MNNLTEKEAFKAMIIFLDAYYERGNGSDSLADVLSAISQNIWSDGYPNDPAIWQDWLDAVNKARLVDNGKGSSLDHIITHKLKNTDE